MAEEATGTTPEDGEGGSEPGTMVKPRNIKWTQILVDSLLDLAVQAQPTRRGYRNRLELLWSKAHPTLPSRSSALAAKLQRVKKKMTPASEPEPEIEADEPESEMDVNEPNIPKGDPSPESGQPLSQILAAAYERAYKMGSRSLSQRSQLNGRWCEKDPKTLEEIDEEMATLWERECTGTIWEINCLIYAGAETFIKMSENHKGKPETNQEADPGDQVIARGENEAGTDSEDGDPDNELTEPEHELTMLEDEDSTNHPQRPEAEEDPVKNRKSKIAKLTKMLGWIEAEITRLRTGSKKCSAKRGRTLKRLSEAVGGKPNRLDLRTLMSLREKQKALRRIKVLQQRKAKMRKDRKTSNEKFTKMGPKSLTKRAPAKEITEKQAEAIARFWRSIWEIEGEHDLSHHSITKWKDRMKEQTEAVENGTPDVESAWGKALKKMKSWKAPGPDGIQGYWLKAFPSTTSKLKEYMREVLSGERAVPGWLVKGRTVLIPKDNCEGEPHQYRPITCLNTTYKLLTSTITNMLMNHVLTYGILPEEQKALRKGRRGCLDALVIDSSVARETKVFNRNLSMGWVDYQKAFDMVPHKWINEVLEAIKAPEQIRKTVKALIPLWKTEIKLKTLEGTTKIRISLKRGVFQGDSLSPLLFCLCVAPLSEMLSEGRGFTSQYQVRPLTHLMFMDDLKVYEESRQALYKTMSKVNEVSRAIGMTLGLGKCAIAHVVGGKVVEGGGLKLSSGGTIKAVGYGDTYKYLGVSQLLGTDLNKTKTRIKMEYYKRLRKTWGSNLNACNTVKANNSWVAGVLQYFYGVVGWNKWDLTKIDRQTRKILRQNKCHHVNASINRLYIPRAKGGRGMTSIEQAWERECVSTTMYLLKSTDPQIIGAMKLQKALMEMGTQNYLEKGQQVVDKYNIGIDLTAPVNGQSPPPKRVKVVLKAAQLEALCSRLDAKTIHGVYKKQTDRPECDRISTFAWLKDGKLQAQTEALIMAAQDGVIHTKAYGYRILKTETDQKCRVCGKGPETLGHILAVCEEYKWGLHKNRHDRVLYQLVKAAAESLNLVIPNELKAPGGVIRGGTVGTADKLMIDQCLPTIETMTERRPDLVVKCPGRKLGIIFEVACAWDPLVKKRETEKKRKYRELAADLAIQWPRFKTRVIPVVIGDLGTVVGLKGSLVSSGIFDEGKANNLVKQIQREALCGTIRIIKRHMAAQ